MTDDATTMRRAIYDLQIWLQRRHLDPTMKVAVLTAALSECAVGHGFKLVTIAEQLVLSGADFHDIWSKKLDLDLDQEAARAE